MNLHQLRFISEAVRQKFNLTLTAQALYTSQPGISSAIMEFEEEVGFQIFQRKGRRLTGLTPIGLDLLPHIETVLREVGNIKRFSDNFKSKTSGSISIATTHTQARYVLPEPVAAFRKRFAHINIGLHQGTPEQVADMLLNGVADIGLATEALAELDELVSIPCYDWGHLLIFPKKHPFANKDHISLEDLRSEPIITYQSSFTGRGKIDQAFAMQHMKPNIVLEALDSDVIRTYVKLGMGVGIVAEMAVDRTLAEQPDGLMVRDAKLLFGMNTARLAFKKGTFLCDFVYAFAQMLNKNLAKELIDLALNDQGSHFDI